MCVCVRAYVCVCVYFGVCVCVHVRSCHVYVCVLACRIIISPHFSKQHMKEMLLADQQVPAKVLGRWRLGGHWTG